MITFVDNATGVRYPEQGAYTSFEYKADGRTLKKWFYRGKGWQTVKKNQFAREEIPDLFPKEGAWYNQPLDEDAYRAYAAKYGEYCAMEFLGCADICKASHSAAILRPDPNKPTDRECQVFHHFFKQNLIAYSDAALFMFNLWGFDTFKFERYLQSTHGYNDEKHGSMADFVKKKFGKDALALIRKLLKRPVVKAKPANA